MGTNGNINGSSPSTVGIGPALGVTSAGDCIIGCLRRWAFISLISLLVWL